MTGPYYELRIYQCVPGRIPDLHRRMTHEVLPLFSRNGVTLPIAYWTGYGGSRAPLYGYLLKWDSLDDRMVNFRKFYTDPDWLKHREESNAGEQMVDRIDVYILRPDGPVSDLLRPDASPDVPALHEIRLQQVLALDGGVGMASWKENDAPFLRDRGARELGTYAMWYGTRMPQIVSMLGWDSAEQRQAAFDALDADAGIAEIRQAERSRHGAPVFGRCESYLLQPEFK